MKNSKSLKSIDDLLERKLITKENAPALQKVVDRFSLLITPSMANLMEEDHHQDPISQQFLPQISELDETDDELADPIGDQVHEVVKGVVHRYPDRCLLKIINTCPIYCRFCFRKEMIGPSKPTLTKQELTTAFEYIRANSEIWEVILTGGDPLLLKPSRLKKILSTLSEIKHVEIVRIHTRIPIVDAERITEELLSALKSYKTLYVAIHANHPKEFTPGAIKACAALVDAGIPLLSQSVLLKGVNDSEPVLVELMKTFVRNKIKPYYLHHPDLAKGTEHFRLSIERGQQLVKSLQGNISGLCQPTYVLDVPGGKGKVPIGPCYLRKQDKNWLLEDFNGETHCY